MTERFRTPEILNEPESKEGLLPPYLCALDLGLAMDGHDFTRVRGDLEGMGLAHIADQLAEYTDVFEQCSVPDCPSFIKLSNQAGTIILLDHGEGADGCIAAGQ